jgi:glycosyltransferase involved in cell wall biosynthesis
MRVLWFTNSPSLAGEILSPGSHVDRGWIGALERKVRECADVTLAVAFPWTEPQVKELIFDGRTYYALARPDHKGKFARWRERLAHSVEMLERPDSLLAAVSMFKPDIIQIFGTEDYYGLLIPRMQVPVVIHIQGNRTVYARRWFCGIPQADVLLRSRLTDLVKGWGLYHDSYVNESMAAQERDVFRFCKYFMGRTEWDRRIAGVLAPSARYYHCDELLRDEFYARTWAPPGERVKKIIFSTIRPALYKGLETVLEAADILLSDLGMDFEWRVAGTPDDHELVRILRHKYGRSPGWNAVRLLGSRSAEELAEELSGADLYVHPSHLENSPNALCEAMVMGVPVVATYAGGIPSLLRNGEEGILVQDGEPYSMAGAIHELCTDQSRAMRYGAHARASALRRHDPDRVVRELLDIYRDICRREEKNIPTPSASEGG